MFQKIFSIFKNKKPDASKILLDMIDDELRNSLVIHKRYNCVAAFYEDVEKIKLLLKVLEKIDNKEYLKVKDKIMKEFTLER
jgi:DNA mismatch repair ATPase MutS